MKKFTLNICLLSALLFACGAIGVNSIKPAQAGQAEGDGSLAVSFYQHGEWQTLGFLGYDKSLSEQKLDLSGLSLGGTRVLLKVEHSGKTAAHVDAALLDGRPPLATYGTDEEPALALRKLARRDFDLIDAQARTLILTYDLPPEGVSTFALTARIEPEFISQIPFQFPSANLYQTMTADAAFYSYPWDSQPGRLTIDGDLEGEQPGQPFFKEFCKTGSGHPDGFTYGWVSNDSENLYVVIDFLPDNTFDGDKDYAKVYVNTPAGLRQFKASVSEQGWGKPGFVYTPRAVYQHKVYEFAIPVQELGMEDLKAGAMLSLAFAAYGTASVVPPAPYPGPLDPTFGIGGLRDDDLGSSYELANVVTQLPDGKLLAAGYIGAPGYDFALVRYDIDGSRDLPFGGNGTGLVTTTFGVGTYDYAYDMAIQDDQKIVLAGVGAGNFALARYHPDGSLDHSFGAGGLVTTNLGYYDTGQAVILQPDQKIVVAGYSGNDFALARYSVTGTLDTSFDTDGIVMTDFNAGSSDFGFDLALQPDGKLVVGGTSQSDFALARYTITGTLDTSFGAGGKVIADLGVSDSAFALKLQPDGKIVLAGYSNMGSGGANFALARFLDNGVLDPNFGIGGVVITNFSLSPPAPASDDMVYELAIQKDGKIVAGGVSGDCFAVARYNPNGSLDPLFGSGGKANTSNVNFLGAGFALTLQSDSKILLAGYHAPGNFGLARYLYLEPTVYLPLVRK